MANSQRISNIGNFCCENRDKSDICIQLQIRCDIRVLTCIHRGSYMRAHVLLISLNELGKRDKMRGLPSILSLFRNEFNKFNKTRERMLDSIYHMTLRIM